MELLGGENPASGGQTKNGGTNASVVNDLQGVRSTHGLIYGGFPLVLVFGVETTCALVDSGKKKGEMV